MPERKAHVKRVFAYSDPNDPKSSIDPDIWIDVLRIDELPVLAQSNQVGNTAQANRFVFHWNDDPNNPLPYVDGSNADQQGENAVGSRQTRQLDVLNPDAPADMHTQLWLVERLNVNFAADTITGKQGQTVKLAFDNQPPSGDDADGTGRPPADRQVTVVKIINNDLGGLKMSDDDGTNPVLVDWNDYAKALNAGTTDDSQRLDVEITERFKTQLSTDEQYPYGFGAGQKTTFALGGNRNVETYFDAGDPKAVDANGNPSVLRTDPLQCIVNVKWGGNNDFVYATYREEATVNVGPPSKQTIPCGNINALYMILETSSGGTTKKTVKPVFKKNILNGFIVYGDQNITAEEGPFFGQEFGGVTDWTKNRILFGYVNGTPSQPQMINETTTLDAPPGVKDNPTLAFPDRGLPVAGDSAGTIYANDTDISKYDGNGNLLWSLDTVLPDWITSEGTNLVVYSQNSITSFDILTGAQTGQVFRPDTGPGGTDNAFFDNDTYGNAYSCERGVALSKYDKNNNILWTVPPLSLGGSDDNPLFTGFVFSLDKFVVAEITDTGYPPTPGGGDLIFNNAFGSAIVVYDETGQLVLNEKLGLFQSTMYQTADGLPNAYITVGGILGRFVTTMARKKRYPPKPTTP